MNLCNIEKTVKWNDVDALGEAFSEALENFFISIYIPVHNYDTTTHKMLDTYTYENIGVSDSQLADMYTTYYGQNYLVEPLKLVATDVTDYATSAAKLGKRIESIFLMNKGKYLKLIELQGYEYNPLWNVDGTETFTYLENEGVNNVTNKSKVGAAIQQTNMYDGSLRDASKVSYEAIGGGETANQVTETTYTHNNADNNGSQYSGGVDEFGNTVVGGDKYHNEKKTRKGNIGVTKTQELIADERENLKFSVIQEFFKDINEQILIGVY